MSLTDELDVGRGDLLARPAEAPEPVRELAATLCWLGDEPARPGARYLIKHTTRSVPAKLDAIEHRLDVTTLADEPADELALNEIGRVRLRLGAPLVPDPTTRSAPPERSSWSTRRRTTRSAPAWSPRERRGDRPAAP